jgi:hypothetical protein
MLSDKSKIRATQNMLLKHKLREGAREINVVPGLYSTLVSIPKMANTDYIAVFDKHKATIDDVTTTTITALANPIVASTQCQTTGLWKLDLDAAVQETQDDTILLATVEAANAIFNLPNNQQTVLYYHAVAGFPPKETFCNALQAENYATWSGLTTQLVNKHLPDSDETQKGHMKRQRQGVQSTKQKALDYTVAKEQNIKIKPGTENAPHSRIKHHEDMFIKIMDLADTIHSNQTGAFLFTLQYGNRCIMVAFHIDANYIFCEPMKNKTEGKMIAAYQQIINRMRTANLGLKHHRLDNEASTAFKECIRDNGMTHKLVFPGNHRRNLAERAIQTFKHHFISILSRVDNKFPLSLWCHLLSPAELTVTLLRQSNIAQKYWPMPTSMANMIT